MRIKFALARFAVLGAALALSGCVDTGVVAPVVALNLTECSLLQAAANLSKRNEASILAGCSGRFQAHRVSDAERLKFQEIAAATLVPPTVAAGGQQSERLFQYLLIRGVPPEVATTLSNTPEFVAVARSRSAA